MNIKLTSLFAALLVCSIFQTFSADKSCNTFVEEVLTAVKSDKEYFEEPYEVPDNQRSFGIYEVDYGCIFGLSSLHRFDDVTTLKREKNPYLKVHLAAGEIVIKSKIKRKFLSFGKSANVDMTIPFIEMTLDIVPKPDGSEPAIKDFKINELKGLDIKVKGAGFIRDRLLNAFTSLVRKFFQNAIKNAIEGKLKSFLKNKVLDYTIPKECLNSAWESAVE